MKAKPNIGLTGQLTFRVEASHAIDFAGDGMPAVLSTPWLIKLLEQTARDSLAPLLEPAERTVGVEIELRHLAPTPVGQQVTCQVRVVQCDGPLVLFAIEARDGVELIARGLHKRAVIQVDRFRRKVEGKSHAR